MERNTHNMANLFAQLGQVSDEQSIAAFIETHRPLPGSMLLHEAAFWSPPQASFLREAIADDADWSEAADTLNVELHAQH